MAQIWGFSSHILLHTEVLFKIPHPVTPLSIFSLKRLKQPEDGLVTGSQDKAPAALATPPDWLLKLPKAEKAKVSGHCLPTRAASLYVFKHRALHFMPPPAAFISMQVTFTQTRKHHRPVQIANVGIQVLETPALQPMNSL